MKCRSHHPYNHWVKCDMDLETEGARKGTHIGAHGAVGSQPGNWLGNSKPVYATRWENAK